MSEDGRWLYKPPEGSRSQRKKQDPARSDFSAGIRESGKTNL